MPTVQWILAGSWAAFVVTWLVTAWRSKRSVGRGRAGAPVTAGFIVVVVILHFLLPRLPPGLAAPAPGLARGVLGSILCAAGVAYAIWARLSLGRNWGMPMSHKERPELVTAGPYAQVRHPIYTGVSLAALGTAAVTGVVGWVVALAIVAYFLVSASHEERHLRTEFPQAFPAYEARTKRFIPFLF